MSLPKDQKQKERDQETIERLKSSKVWKRFYTDLLIPFFEDISDVNRKVLPDAYPRTPSEEFVARKIAAMFVDQFMQQLAPMTKEEAEKDKTLDSME